MIPRIDRAGRCSGDRPGGRGPARNRPRRAGCLRPAAPEPASNQATSIAAAICPHSRTKHDRAPARARPGSDRPKPEASWTPGSPRPGPARDAEGAGVDDPSEVPPWGDGVCGDRVIDSPPAGMRRGRRRDRVGGIGHAQALRVRPGGGGGDRPVVGDGAARAQGPPGEAAPAEIRRPLADGAASVRLRLGVGDAGTRPWDGRVALDRGEVLAVEPDRFRPGDEVTGPDSWRARSMVVRKASTKVAAKKAQAKAAGGAGPEIGPAGLVVTVRAPADATLTVVTEQGTARIPLADLARGGAEALPRRPRSRRRPSRPTPRWPSARARRTSPPPPPTARAAPGSPTSSTSPAARRPLEAISGQAQELRELHPRGRRRPGQARSTSMASSRRPGARRDRRRPRRLAARRGRRRRRAGGGRLVRATRRQLGPLRPTLRPRPTVLGRAATADRRTPAPTADAVLATGPDGRVWMAWQAWRDGQADILPRPASTTPRRRSTSATTRRTTGRRRWPSTTAGGLTSPSTATATAITTCSSPPAPTAVTPGWSPWPTRPGSRPGPAWRVDRQRPGLGRLRGARPTTGARTSASIDGEAGTPLYRESAVRVRCVEGEQGAATPATRSPRLPRPGRSGSNRSARLALDHSGRPWLLFRHRQEAIWGDNTVMVVGGVWVEYATSLVGDAWATPRPLPRSDGLLDNRPALVAHARRPAAGLLQHRRPAAPRGRVHPRPAAAVLHATPGTPPGWVNNDLFVAALAAAGDGGGRPAPRRPGAPSPSRSRRSTRTRPRPSPGCGGTAINAGGKTYQLLRGEFHRHTEISQRRRRRRRARGHVALRHRRRPTSTGSATATTTTAAARSTPGG